MEKGLILANLIVCRAEQNARKIPEDQIDGYYTALDFIAKELKKEYEQIRTSQYL